MLFDFFRQLFALADNITAMLVIIFHSCLLENTFVYYPGQSAGWGTRIKIGKLACYMVKVMNDECWDKYYKLSVIIINQVLLPLISSLINGGIV